jgi:hypothetical protein
MNSKFYEMTLIIALVSVLISGLALMTACGDDDDDDDVGWLDGNDENDDVDQPDDDDSSDDDDEDDDDNGDDDNGDDDDTDDDDNTEEGPDYAKDHSDNWNCYLCHTTTHGNLYNAPSECLICHSPGDAASSKPRDDIPHNPNILKNCKSCHNKEHPNMFPENEMCTVCHQEASS